MDSLIPQLTPQRPTRTVIGPAMTTPASTSTSTRSYEHSFSFAGAGWMMVYEFGVAKVLQRFGIHTKSRFIGTSAGSLASVGLTLDNDFDAIVDTVINEYVPEVYASLQGPFKMRKYLVHALTTHANLDRFQDLNSEPGRATFVYTSLSTMKARRVTAGFKSPDHLLKTLIASCCATPLVGLPFMLDGELVIDGGVLDNQPLFDDDPEGDHTVTVNPNYLSGADIKPSQYLPPWWTMYPPSQQDMYWAYHLGQKDALQWLVRRGLITEEDCALVKAATAEMKEEEEEDERVWHEAATPALSVTEWKTHSGKWVGYRGMDERFYQVMMLWAFVYAMVVSVAVSWQQRSQWQPRADGGSGGGETLKPTMGARRAVLTRGNSGIVGTMATLRPKPVVSPSQSSNVLVLVAMVSTAIVISTI